MKQEKIQAILQAIKNRTSNYAFWTSLIALVPLVLRVFGIYELPEGYDQLVQGLLAFLVTCGIINNPTTNSKWYGDDKKPNDEENNN